MKLSVELPPMDWTTDSKPLTYFTIFPKLPVEVRLKIWELSWEPRSVEIVAAVEEEIIPSQKELSSHAIDAEEIPRRMFYRRHDLFTSTTSNPASFSINQESRGHVLKTYKYIFSNGDQRIYFHPAIDTMIINHVLIGPATRYRANCWLVEKFTLSAESLWFGDVVKYRDGSRDRNVTETISLGRVFGLFGGMKEITFTIDAESQRVKSWKSRLPWGPKNFKDHSEKLVEKEIQNYQEYYPEWISPVWRIVEV